MSLGSRGIFAGKTVSLACADLPVGASCTFAPRTLTPDAGGATSVLTVTTDGSEGELRGPIRRAKLPLGLAALVFAGLVLGRSNGLRRRRTFLSLGLVLLAVGLYTGCADEVVGPHGIQPTPRGTHAFKVIATAGDEERAVAVTLTVGAPEALSEDRAMRGPAPHMHDGSLATLEDVIEFYDRGGNENPYLDGNVRSLNLTAEL